MFLALVLVLLTSFDALFEQSELLQKFAWSIDWPTLTLESWCELTEALLLPLFEQPELSQALSCEIS